MTETNPMVPTTGCLLAGGVQVYPTRDAEYITQHYRSTGCAPISRSSSS
jgi:hypothetical protein